MSNIRTRTYMVTIMTLKRDDCASTVSPITCGEIRKAISSCYPRCVSVEVERKLGIGSRIVTNGATPLDNTKPLMPNRNGTIVGIDTDGKFRVKMDDEEEINFISEREMDLVD